MKSKNIFYVTCIVIMVCCGVLVKSKMGENPKIERIQDRLSKATEAFEPGEDYLTVFDIGMMQEVISLVRNYDSLSSEQQHIVQKMLKTDDQEEFLQLCNHLLGYHNEPLFVGPELTDEDYD